MAKQTKRSEAERAIRADPRYSELPQPCQHCKNLVSMGTQFDADGWTCKAYPSQIPYSILTLREPHTDVRDSQPGDMVAFDPIIYTEMDTGKQWHYTADGDWKYVDEGEGDGHSAKQGH